MKIALGADHRGFVVKEFLRRENFIGDMPVVWIDCGAHDAHRSDYPLFVQKVCELVLKKEVGAGILFCATGIGMSIAANRNSGIRAAIVWNETVARLAKEDDDANVLVLPADFVSLKDVLRIIQAWQNAQFKGGRYQERLAMFD
jgi:ribose 5-phosphate isomerase B